MAYSEAQKKASRKYNESNYKRINMYLAPEDKEKWQEEAYMKGMNLSEFIKQCVNNSIEDDKEIDDFDKLKYWGSKYAKEHYYTCPVCKIAIKDFLIEHGSYRCVCGANFDKSDAKEAKDRYIKKLEKQLEEYKDISELTECLKKEEYERLLAAANSINMSVNGFIKRCVNEKISNM